jgi:hypothetical protein
MSKPCACGASKTLQGCPPCHREHLKRKCKRYYWKHVAPLKTRQRGRPRNGEIRTVSRLAADFLRMPLRLP